MSSCSELLMSLLLCVHVQSLSHVQLFVTPMDCSPPVSLHMEFSRQEYWSGSPFPTPRDLLAMRATWVQSPGCEDPLEKKLATHSSLLAWKIPWTEDLVGYSSQSCRVRCDLNRRAGRRLNLQFYQEIENHSDQWFYKLFVCKSLKNFIFIHIVLKELKMYCYVEPLRQNQDPA